MTYNAQTISCDVAQYVLTYIVAEHILDEPQSMMRHNLVEDDLLLLLIRTFDFLLDKPRAVLVRAEFYYVAIDILDNQ